jgi:hypothetical protein
MPMVARMLQSLSGIQPERSVNPDEAVARGAALYAGHLVARRSGAGQSTFQVTNVNAHALGVEGIDAETLRKRNVVLIPRNTPLPARRTERFATKSEGQRSIAIKVLEGESTQPADCIAIGRTVVRDLPGGLPKGWPVEVTFEYGINGRLAVDALVPGTQHHARLELERQRGLSNEGLSRWKQPVNDAGGFDTFELAIQDVLQATPPAHASSSSGIGWAAAAPETSATSAAGPTPIVASPTSLAASPIEPAAAAGDQSWASRPQALSVSSPNPGAVASVNVKPAAAEEPVLPLIKRAKPEINRRIPKWVERLIGHIITLLILAFVGYLMISHLRPDLLRPIFGGGNQQNEQKPSGPAP